MELKFVLILKLMFVSLLYLQSTTGKPKGIRSLDFEDCGSSYDLISVRISTCETTPCQVPMGSIVQLTADFLTDDHDINSTLTHQANWILYSIVTPATISPEACDGDFCPFKSYEGLGFSADLMVNETLPAIKGSLYWRVKNPYNVLVMCFKVPISIVL
ncbi:NPC intracellular cholesterol transporter 2 [Pseudolycoriella hygida]|uniref:NPC intracellular cholesterol transporter 2 n=1 Tax=Pseudolycoriella hygida TaxID=35572 RepID=A0A9Q0MSR9_9DIPT|nr:NPC intracellular cholesterol transporter 2 [Pseudolycoriella hygida]